MSVFKPWLIRLGLVPAPIEDAEPIDIDKVLEHIKNKEEGSPIEAGRKIHSFYHGSMEIRIDRDISENYRVTVWEGSDRIYSFTVFATQGTYSLLGEALAEIEDFLNGTRSITDLPNTEQLKGFYYGNS